MYEPVMLPLALTVAAVKAAVITALPAVKLPEYTGRKLATLALLYVPAKDMGAPLA